MGERWYWIFNNALNYWRDSPEWREIKAKGFRQFVYDADDPLADTFLIQHGAYPDPADAGIDYAEALSQATLVIQSRIEQKAPILMECLDHPSCAYLSRRGLRRHYTVRPGWSYQGFYVGDATSIDDLVCFWNLRAADIVLQFYDLAHAERYAIIRPEYEKRTLAGLAHLDEHHRNIAIWSRAENLDAALKEFGGRRLTACAASGPFFWNGGGVRPPMMIFGEASSLGVFGQSQGIPRVSFALNSKPFAADQWFHTQHLVASVALRTHDEHHTFHPPFVPEWNEFYARQMHGVYNKLRVEPERIGVVVDVADHDSALSGLPVTALTEQLFASAGFNAKLSSGGLITRQVISRLGGIDGARVFKIPGVRRLLKQYGPREAFTKDAALQLIGQTVAGNPQGRFDDHKDLYIEPRPHGTELTPQMVFEYLVQKGLFRIGADLTCTSCGLRNWIALDVLKQANVCELCGTEFDATRQLVKGVLHYRRTGVLGLEKNTMGAVPVVLVLQQLENNLDGVLHNGVYAPSYDLEPRAGDYGRSLEVDFLMVLPRIFPERAQVALGECKDEGGHIDADDIENLRRVADALPRDRFDSYIILAKLGPFTTEEIALARGLNGPCENQVILLTSRELEPYDLFERTREETGIASHGGSLEELAQVTRHIYFPEASSAAPEGGER